MIRSRSSIVEAAFGLRFLDSGTFLNPFRDAARDIGIEVCPDLTTRHRNGVEILNRIATFGVGNVVQMHLLLLRHDRLRDC
jgi:hypothetical protein